jgi:hypothetical protein
MPKFLIDKLKKEYGANSKIPYKVANSIGAMRGNKETEKGAEMQAKHEADMKKFSGSVSGYKHSRPTHKVVKRTFRNA